MKSSSVLIEYDGMNPLLTEDNVRCIGEDDHFSRLLAWVGDNAKIIKHCATNFDQCLSDDMIACYGSDHTHETHSNSDFWMENNGEPHFTIFGPPSEEGYDGDTEHSLNEGVFCVPRDYSDSDAGHSYETDWEQNFYDVVEAIGWTLIWE